MCLSHRKQSRQGRSSICNALLSDRAYRKQFPYDHRKPPRYALEEINQGCADLEAGKNLRGVVVFEGWDSFS